MASEIGNQLVSNSSLAKLSAARVLVPIVSFDLTFGSSRRLPKGQQPLMAGCMKASLPERFLLPASQAALTTSPMSSCLAPVLCMAVHGLDFHRQHPLVQESPSIAEDNLGAGPPVVGTLEHMAHPDELVERSSDPFEREDPSDRSTARAHLAVMSFSKGKKLEPERIRTRKALEKTQLHLRRILDSSGARLEEMYAFLDNRNRALHGDYRVQHLSDHQILYWIAEHVGGAHRDSVVL